MEEKKFTETDLLKTIEECAWPQYCKYPAIRGMIEFEDLVQDCALSFYEIMKSTGKPRLEYYNSYLPWKAVRSIVRLCTKQCVPNYLRCNFCKYFPSSLNTPISNDTDTEWIELVPSLDEDLLSQTQLDDIMTKLNEDQRNVVSDLLAGFTKTSLREKYKRFDYIVEEIRDIIEYYYRRSSDVLPSAIENRKFV